ncbi:twin-arginine translocase subunit TatB [Loktanella sp. D2R18]|uniref:Sec-independent protein translocase protein TatB n=1 Tax=Rhodobacterales TaxID=204455 RepID=UPI000DEB1C21|nr:MULTISPECIES: Sec-independent protein translocase protein TatB [Rhodobacterales]MDO6591851.1 Sec-independent protein translocase protein TatB [Yoonia sp. 1_MG-2023]RBW44851.1 twin-arginine translocase subunit TatB [Loktanella sp. D2R18]
MFGLGWSEMVLVGIVALIVIGPKDLPGMFRTLGQFTGKARGMAREFSRAMESAADEAGIGEIQKTVRAAANPQKFGVDKIKEATGMTQAPEKPALSPERQAIKEKMSDAMGKAATERQAREAEAEAAPEAKPTETPESDSK